MCIYPTEVMGFISKFASIGRTDNPLKTLELTLAILAYIVLQLKKIYFHSFSKRSSAHMATGTVKWFSDAKGFGFIEPDEKGVAVFAHFSAIQMDGFRTLKQGARVSYELQDGPKGPHACNITTAPAAALEQQPTPAPLDAANMADHAVVEPDLASTQNALSA